jgi:hypothetical protein
MNQALVGIIGGSGSQMDALEGAQEWSARRLARRLTCWSLAVCMAYQWFSWPGMRAPPSAALEVPYRANIHAMKEVKRALPVAGVVRVH